MPVDPQKYFICTYTGKRFHFLKPTNSEIDIEDIVHALSLTCRFGGQCREFYSVAQHCVEVVCFINNNFPNRIDLRKWALLHDAAEAYIGDVVSPLKNRVQRFGQIEKIILKAVAFKYGLTGDTIPFEVKDADGVCTQNEAQHLMPEDAIWYPRVVVPFINPQSPKEAEHSFLSVYQTLFNKKV